MSVLKVQSALLTPLVLLCACSILALAVPYDAQAQAIPEDAKDIGTVTANGTAISGGELIHTPGTAPYTAPSVAPLDAGQPTSIVGPHFIENNISPTQNYDEIIKYTPSVQNVAPTGPGLQQNFWESIRGFSYKQFNTTFDGIVVPGTLSNFAPQSAAYFTSHNIGSVQVDRGPGTASTLGYATFGGTVAMNSRPLLDRFTVNAYGTGGSFNTLMGGVQVNSGILPELNGARGYIDMSTLDSNCYPTETTTERNNFFGKMDIPVGDSTLLSFVGMYNSSVSRTFNGAQLGQFAAFGQNYGLNNNPLSQAYKNYNVDTYTTDFEYVGVKSDLGDGWKLDNKTYTASYYRRGTDAKSPNGTLDPSDPAGNLNGYYYVNGVRTLLNNAPPGRDPQSDFRDWGNILRVTKDTDIGQARVGMWIDYNAGINRRTNIVLNQNNALYTKSATASPYDYNYKTDLTTLQPYLEFAFKPLKDLTITPGLKYTSTTRGLNAVMNATTRQPASYSQTYDALQPSIEVRYALNDNWSTYGQIAKGFLAPPLGVLQTTAPQALNPQETVNYQVGTVYQTEAVALGADLYYINFNNYISSKTVNGTVLYSNSAGAIYKGAEVEAMIRLGDGLSLYANGSINNADYRGNRGQVAAVPNRVAAFGPIIERDGFYASWLTKYVGNQYGQDLPNAYLIRGYTTSDMVFGYTMPIQNDRKIDFRLYLNNVTNDQSVIFLTGTAANGNALFYTNAGFSAFFSVSVSL